MRFARSSKSKSRNKIPASSLMIGCAALSLAACGEPAPAQVESRTSALLRPTPTPASTVTIHVHGWNLSGSTDDGVFGDDRGGGATVDGIIKYAGLPHGQRTPAAANQIVGTEYYGNKYPSYYTTADIGLIDSLRGIPRYAAIVGKYARHVMQRAGAEGVNLTCHSMGCEISRYLIENDVEKLITDGKLRRWVSFAGVVNGAKLAEIDGGRKLSDLARLLGLDLIDVQQMNYTWVSDLVAVYDHKRLEGNNPNFANLLVHHILATNPKIDTAASIPLMDVLGFSTVPNDGIVLADDMYLHGQQPDARWETPSGALLEAGQSRHFANHFNITETASAQAIAAAHLVGSRRVRVTLSSVTLLKEHESIFFDKSPAEVVVESQIRYPYLKTIDPTDLLIDEVSTERRNAPMYVMSKNETKATNYVVFEGPVFDAQTSVAVSVKLSETDFYPAKGLNENLLSKPFELATLNQELPLTSGDYTATTADARFTLHVDVEKLY